MLTAANLSCHFPTIGNSGKKCFLFFLTYTRSSAAMRVVKWGWVDSLFRVPSEAQIESHALYMYSVGTLSVEIPANCFYLWIYI